jgi:hypothetical protein
MKKRPQLTTAESLKILTTFRIANTIGAWQFFEGWLHQAWEETQEKYYQDTNSLRSVKRWTLAVITKLWDIAWDLWDFCNAVYHQQMNRATSEDTSALDLQIRELRHTTTLIGLLQKDSHLTSITLTRLLAFPRLHKVEWIQQTTLALAHAKSRHFRYQRSQQEHHRRQQTMIRLIQLYLRNWLNSS